MRQIIINRDNRICALCNKFVEDIPEVDHIIELTKDNYKDTNISLNPDNLRTVHKKCHNKRHNRYQGNEKSTILDENLNIDYKKRGRDCENTVY